MSRFNIIWRNAAYYVSIPEYNGGEVVTADEYDALRAELKATQEGRDKLRSENAQLGEEIERTTAAKDAEIARLRGDINTAYVLGAASRDAELDRMRKALELNVECSCHQREDGTACWLCCALNPQPAQPEKP